MFPDYNLSCPGIDWKEERIKSLEKIIEKQLKEIEQLKEMIKITRQNT